MFYGQFGAVDHESDVIFSIRPISIGQDWKNTLKIAEMFEILLLWYLHSRYMVYRQFEGVGIAQIRCFLDSAHFDQLGQKKTNENGLNIRKFP